MDTPQRPPFLSRGINRACHGWRDHWQRSWGIGSWSRQKRSVRCHSESYGPDPHHPKNPFVLRRAVMGK